MSIVNESIKPVDPARQVDLLVDGELSEADRRELLVRLEHEPDGWRRCALAFLEAQCWKTELGELVPAAAVGPAAAEAISPGPRGQRQSWHQHVATVLSMAASFLLALVVGMGLSGNPLRLPVTAVREKIAAVVPESAVQMPQSTEGSEMVALTPGQLSGGQVAAAFCVPAQRRNALDQNSLESIPDAIPPVVRQAFEQSGYRVMQHREIVPVPMKDGRRLVVPVDRIEIHYVGRPSL